MNWKPILIILAVVVLLVAALLAKPVQVGIRTAAVFLDMGLSYKWHVTIPRNIMIFEVTYPCDNRDVVANLYQPNDQCRHSGLILAPGAVKDGKDDAALTLAAQSLARAGYVVLLPQLDNLRSFRLHQDDIETLVASFQYLSKQQFINGRIGMVGICLSAPLVLLAAVDPDISQDIAIVSSWGGYYNINDWLQSVITERYSDQGRIVAWKPRATLTEAVSKWFIEFLPDPSERALVGEMLEGSSAPPAEGKLSASGQTIYELLNNRDPERVPELWVRLGPEIQQTLDGLSPHLEIDQLRTKVAIIHTLTDDVIPWVESRKLAEAIDDEQEVYFKVFGRFYHTDIKQLLNVRLSNLVGIVSEATQFYLYICSILYQL